MLKTLPFWNVWCIMLQAQWVSLNLQNCLRCEVTCLANTLHLLHLLLQYFETADQLEWDMSIPEPDRYARIQYPDSGSEWDGMDEGWSRISGSASSG